MRNIITNKEKEIFFRVAYKQYDDWKKKPDDLKDSLERMGIYMTLFSQFENRMRVLYWTTTFHEGHLVPTGKQDGMDALTPIEFTNIMKDPYPPNAPKHITLGWMNTLLRNNKVIRSDKFDDCLKIINHRNELGHQFFLKQDKLTNEDIDDVVRSFRYIDKLIKQKRSVYKKRRGNKGVKGKKIIRAVQSSA